MIKSYPAAATNISTGVTTVDCQKQVRSWRLLRAIMEFLIPSCNCTFVEEDTDDENSSQTSDNYQRRQQPPYISSSSTTITGTLFGYRRGKVSFCIQTSSKSSAAAAPLLLLELAVSTTTLAREMRGGVLRIALESKRNGSPGTPLLSTPVWNMYCNGRKVGLAVSRRPGKADMEVLQRMRSVVVGAGIINGQDLNRKDDIMYLKGKFERVHGSSESESFHLIDPDGNVGQELGIFFLQSRQH
ncbi:PREDICTED: protein MIZU-KUSSEI 1-like [Ipomoea nil]|uniref:protein MIZU-KUSSEI 1-like n=1 Tax=Ipomoea nil TaxID=35883 RepID=UPI000901C27C|nr:PREDICTED: protein MIZU-KUSSEI 1-like [Ipomoea nil]